MVKVIVSVVDSWVVTLQPQTETVTPSLADPSVSVYSVNFLQTLDPPVLSAIEEWLLEAPSAVAILSVAKETKQCRLTTILAEGATEILLSADSSTAVPALTQAE